MDGYNEHTTHGAVIKARETLIRVRRRCVTRRRPGGPCTTPRGYVTARPVTVVTVDVVVVLYYCVRATRRPPIPCETESAPPVTRTPLFTSNNVHRAPGIFTGIFTYSLFPRVFLERRVSDRSSREIIISPSNPFFSRPHMRPRRIRSPVIH